MTSEVLRVLVVDDESTARKRLERLIGTIDGTECVGSLSSAGQFLDALENEEVDVVFLDVQMPGMSGIEAARLVEEGSPYIIFTTAHSQHALDAFQVGAVDYLLKPVDEVRLKQSLDRARARIMDVATDADPLLKTRLPVRTHKGVRLLEIENILSAELEEELVVLRYGAEKIVTDMRLLELETKLPKGIFERVHRRAIANMLRIERLESLDTGGYMAWLSGGGSLPVSRQAARMLRRRLGIARE